MTGLSVLFNLNTEEACYVYGHMESHRRTNEQSINQRYSGLPSTGRQRNFGDIRYTGNTDPSSYTPTYSDHTPHYRSSHGFSDFPRESYVSSPTLSSKGIFSDGDSMSKYTRGYDISNRNTSDYTATKSYDSPRFYDRGKFGTDRPGSEAVSPPFEFGVSYKSPRTHDTSTKSHDITTRTYDRNTIIDDVTTRRSPARITSISDRDVVNKQAHADAPFDRRRQRQGSSDSSSSHSSEKSGSTDDRSLFNALKHRYKETAEKQYDDPGARAPFSSWRRSGNFEEMASSIAPEAQKEKTKSLERKTYHRESDKSSPRGGSYHEEDSRSSFKDIDRSRSNVKDSSAYSEKHGEMSPDELIFNFRQALCRHAISEKEKAQEQGRGADSNVPTLDIEGDATAQRLERLRVARAKIHEQRQSDKVHSQSFATEFKVDKDRNEKSRSESTSSVSSQKSDRDRVHTDEPVSMLDEQKQKNATKLARQKLVSDDLKAKYMIKRDDDREKTPTNDDSLTRKRSSRKDRLDEHKDFWSKKSEHDKDTSSVRSKSSESDSVPTIEEMLHGSSKQAKSFVSKKFENVDHSSPFGSVYSKPSPVVTTSSVSTSSSATAAAATAVTSTSSTYHTQPEKIEKSKNEKSKEKTQSKKVEIDTKESKVETQKDTSDRKYKKYAKAKSLELGALTKKDKTDNVKPAETKDDSKLDSAEDQAQLSRVERIAKYKEERRKQLKTLQERFAKGESSELPSLFLSSKPEQEDSSISRSRSLKVESSDNKQESSISRSRSMKQDASYSDRSSPALGEPHKMPGLKLAELGTQSKPLEVNKGKDIYESSEQKYNTDNIIDKLQALKKLKEEHAKRSGAVQGEGINIRYSKEIKDDEVDVGKPVSYASKALLADRVMEKSSREKAQSPVRERIRSSSIERETAGKTDKTFKQPLPKETEQKSYFEFGTVFTKKERKPENKRDEKSLNLEDKKEVEKDIDSERDSADSSSRIRRKLPSVEDVLGTGSTVKDTDKVGNIGQEKLLKKEKEVENIKQYKNEVSKEELSSMTAEQISKRKVAENIERAKHKFVEDDKHASAFDASRFELGTVYTSKKADKKSVSDKSVKQEIKSEENFNKKDSLERSRQILLGVSSESENVQKKPQAHKDEKQGTAFAQSEIQTQPERKRSHRKEKQLNDEIRSQHLDKNVKEEKPQSVTDDKSRKPPSSPRSERRKQAEERFGKASEMPGFDFGTSYVKKEQVVPKQEENAKRSMKSEVQSKKEETNQNAKQILSGSFENKEKSSKPTPEMKTGIIPKTSSDSEKSKIPKSRSRRDRHRQQEEQDFVSTAAPPEVKSSLESQVKLDMKAKTVSTATGKTPEVPSSPRGVSPSRAFAKTFESVPSKQDNISERVVAKTEVKPMKFDVKSSKTTTELSRKEPPKVTQKVEEVTRVTNIEKTVESPIERPPVRQTSFTSLEVKTPTSAKTPETPVKQTVEKVKEKSVFSFENQSKPKPPSITETITKQDVAKQETKMEVKPVEITKKPVESKIEVTEIKTVKDENMTESLFELHRKRVEEKLEKKRESIHVEDKPVEKHEKPSEIFELHKKQIAEKLDPRLVPIHAEEKITTKPDIDMIGKHEIDSKIIEMHRKEIEEKLDMKHEQKHDHKEVEKPDKVLRIERYRPDKSKIIKPVGAKSKVDKSLMDTSLDDILSKNVEYLSDLEPPEFKRGRAGGRGKKERPQSTHEPQKGKRILKKKSTSRRSKSEDRSHFKVPGSDEEGEVTRAKVVEDLPRSSVKVKASTQMTTARVTSSSSGTTTVQQKTPAVPSQESSIEKSSDKLSHQSVSSQGTKTIQNDKPVLKQEVQSVYQSREQFDQKQNKNEYQSSSASGIQKSSTSVSEMLYSGNIHRNVSDNAANVSQTELTSGMTSDASDFSERRRFVTRETDAHRLGTDSDQSASSSAMSEGSRKRRKDKSSMRKSKLNESSEDAASSGRRFDSSDDSSKASRVGVRRVSSSRLSRESREDKYKGEQQEVFEALKRHDLEISLTKPGTSHLSSYGNQSTDKHAINTDHKHLNNIESPRYANKSVLDSNSVLPSRFALPSKVSAAISKLTESSDKTSQEGSSKKTEESHSPKRIRRGNNFSQLLQKFSGSEASSSERSDSESPRRNKIFLKRQQACAVSSGSSDETRRTPERTQSLKLRNKESPVMEKESVSSVQRSSSFKSDFMKRKFSPEPDNRRRLPSTPNEQSDQPSPELAKVLSKRNEIVAKQQEDGKVLERQRIHDGRVEKSDRHYAAVDDEVIADSEVLKMLKSRRKETDSSIEASSVSESDNKSQKLTSNVESAFKSDTRTQLFSQSPHSSLESGKERGRLQSQSSVESKLTVNLTTTGKEKSSLPASNSDKSESAKSKSDVPHLDLASIDTSLDVLKSVTDDLDDTKHSSDKFSSDLSHLKVTSPTQVATFIKAVESDSNSQSEAKMKSIHTRIEAEEQKFARSTAIETKAETVQRPSSPTSPSQGSINITSKSEIMRKISTKERTPERQSPKRSGPMKVTTPLNASGSGLTRTESVGRTESERPKGILKRTPSLKQSGVIVDPELAEVLKSRRQRHDEVDEEEEDQKLTAQEEIQKAREEAQQKDDAPKEREVSVAERIFQMHTKIEEVKSCPITPKARSGFTTPKSALQRSGNISPKNQFSFDEGSKQPELSGSQLIERLSSLEGRQTNISEKRQKFQQRRQRDDARTRTQPVTLQEIQLADSLETVKKFRSEVIQKSSTNVFEALQKEERQAPAKKTEFPQELRLERRSRGQRHKTLPVTAAELNAIPEDKPSETMNSLKKKFDSFGARDSKADSGILSGSEGEIITQEIESWRSLSVEENIGEDDPVKLSVSAKASMFHQIQESLKERQEKKSASGAKRYIDRKKRERSRTLPITEDEVKLAAEIADKEEEEAKKAEETQVTIGTEEAEVDSDELSRQSLKDKVKLFTSIEEDKKAIAAKKGLPPPPKRKNRKLASRFATQPVTFEEVEKAAKISPLACSLVKPPDPEILSGLSVKAQRELIAQHAQQTLSQPSSRSSSRVPSRATSIGDLSTEFINKDSLTATNTNINQNNSAVEVSLETVRPSDVRVKGFEVKKQEESVQVHSSQTVGKITTSKLDSQKKNILKSQLEEKLSLLHKAPIGLKPNSDVVPTISDINKALQKTQSVEISKSSEVRGILKKEGSFETRKMDVETVSAIKCSELTTETVEEVDSEGNVVEGFDSSGDNLDSDEAPVDSEGDKIKADTPVKRGSKARRRFNRDRKLEQERYKTQPTEGSVESADSSRVKKKYTGRHFTQPVTPDEKEEAEIATDMPEITKTGSIHDRLNALKKSGDEEWKKRVSRPIDLDKLDRRSASPELTPPTIVKMREKKGLDTPRPSSIADRLSALDNAQEGWRDRVGETDVKKFTIEHKITSSGQTVGESPLVSRLRGKTPRKERSQDSDTSENSDLISPTSPTKPLPKEVVCADLPTEMLVQESQSPLAKFTAVEEEKSSSTVAVPEVGAELDSFFKTSEKVSIKSEELDVSVDDFNELFLEANDMLETTRRVKPKRRYNTKSRNPLKTMSACLEVKSEYTEVIHGVAERELKSVKVAALQQNSGFAVEALAGLASKENFSKVELRKTDSNGAGSSGSNSRLEPYLPLMLIHIKGRRKVQCRLVEPKAESVNSGDCYVLVTPDKIINWVGDYCNVIEKAKAADVCDFIKQKRDLGCKQAREVTIVEEKKGRLGNARHFWDLLGGHKPYMASGPTEEDELYESHIVETNMIYKLEENKLVPEQEYWGNQPKYEMLHSSQVFVFDFGSELYLWQGKAVPPNQRKISLKLAQQLWSQGYDYSKCEVNPVSPLRTENEGGAPSVCDKRPDWALFGKVNENMETILFREKFADWPDTSRLIKVKSQEEVNTKFDLADLKAYDATLMVPVDTKPVSMALEGSHVGRGTKWEQDMDGFIQEQEIQTRKVRVWHVLEYDHYEIEDHSYGQFHEGDTYVVRWQYMIVNAGMKSLKGNASRFSQMGRERCAYFFWQGKSSTINEKGASALMTVELDEERGPQVRVSEGKEPPCFLNLFKGRTIIHIGKREEEETNTQGPWRFYCLRNEYENEMCLIEVPKDISNLRSVSSCILLNVVTGKLTVWHGCKSPEHTRKLAKKAADNLKERCPLEVGLHKGVDIDISEVEEGQERTDFWRMVNVHIGDRSKYHCLLDNPESFNHTLRLFHMTSVSGIFEAHEILNPTRTPELPTKFPALQTDLYMAQQPTLFLIDNGHEVYLWQGWWPEGDEEQENVLTGSAQTRFTADRRCAMETTLAYCKEINPESPPPAYMVYAGLEPLSFTNLFPFWTVDENVREINLRLAIDQESSIKIIHQDGKTEGELVPVQDLLKKLTKTRYTFAELLETPLPEGVDPLKLESYLSDQEFEAVLEMTREEFYNLPGWKQQKLKQQVELY